MARSTGQGAFVSYGILACSYSEEKFCSSNQIGPNNADTKAINEIGWIYYNKGDKENAVAQWEKTLKINRNDRDAILNLAKAYNDLAWNALKSGKTKEAIKYRGKTITINPGNKAAKYYLKKYNPG